MVKRSRRIYLRKEKKFKRRRRIVFISVICILVLASIAIYKIVDKNSVDFLTTLNRGSYSIKSLRKHQKEYEENLNIKALDFDLGEKIELGNKPEYLVYHHTASKSISAEEINKMHIEEGWKGMGYHFYIRTDGTIYKGRQEQEVGAHAIGKNRNSIGICLEGNFEESSPSEEQVKSLVKLSTDMIVKYNIKDVIGHKDTYNTLCPGENFDIDSIKEKVANEIIKINEN